MLKLQEDGLLDLDDTIGTWIQGVANVNGQITIRQMLNHTSGLYNFTNNPAFTAALNNDPSATWQPEDVLQFVNAPSFAPGADWEYSNTNYLIAGLIIKDIFGVPYYQALRDSILAPNGLIHSVNIPFEQPATMIPHYWSIHFGAPYLVDGATVGWDQTGMASMATAAGAIFSTAEENVKFWNLLMSGALINNASLQEMQQCIPLSPTMGYGLGIFKRANFGGHVAYSHGGTNVGFINENIVDSVTGTCISVLTNQDSVSNTILLLRVVAALHKETLAPLNVATVYNNMDVVVYPNPAHNDINILTDEAATMQLTDISGKKILHATLKEGTNNIPLQGISTGLYFLRVINNNDQIVYSGKVSVY
jgi:D-alanyl-D-alanine carboxypeptidase